MRHSLNLLSTTLCWIAALALFAAMALIGTDVLLRIMANRPILGSSDMVEVLFSIVVFFALPEVFRRRMQIVVDMIDLLVSSRVVARLMVMAFAVSVAAVGLLIFEFVNPVIDLYETGSATLNIDIPLWISGVIALTGLTLGLIMEIYNFIDSLSPQQAAEKQ